MTQDLFSRRSRTLGLSGVLAVLLVSVAARPALAASPALPAPSNSSGVRPVDTSACHDPELSQPFLSSHDANSYTLVPGQTFDNFDGSGWTLSGGATTTTTTLADGATGSVLDLPSGSKAESPIICVKSDYPTARTMVRNMTGGNGVFFYVSYAGTKTETTPQNTGQLHGNGTNWTLSNPLNVDPGKSDGWQPVRITLIAGGHSSEFELYNLFVDPRCRM
jgi:hypothetical protein